MLKPTGNECIDVPCGKEAPHLHTVGQMNPDAEPNELTFFQVNAAGGFLPISAILLLPISICSAV